MSRIYKVGISTIKEKSQGHSLVAKHCLVSNINQMDDIKRKRQNPLEIRYSSGNIAEGLGTILRYINAPIYIPNFHYYNNKKS